MMAPTTATTSGATGVPLHVRSWIPPSPRALVLVVHGVGEHGGRYAELAAVFGRRGFGMVAHDHQGHGLSGGRRGDVPRFGDYADDLACVLTSVRDGYPGTPLVLLGHSMGGVVAAQLLLRASAVPVAGLVLSSAGFVPVVPIATWKRLMADVLVHAWPSLLLPTGIAPEQLSRDAVVVKAFREDPLTYSKVSLRWYTGFTQACRQCLAQAERLSLPLYAFHGTDDSVIALSGTEQFVRAAASADKTLRVWPGLRHETLNESEPERSGVVNELVAWLEQRHRARRTSGLG
ncbi:MAG: lysophospholipase [Polyangiaceae bacterium]|nr:lysophospholipase [Polyangiaceae bacterium]